MQAELLEAKQEAEAHEAQNGELKSTLKQQQELVQSMQVGISHFRTWIHQLVSLHPYLCPRISLLVSSSINASLTHLLHLLYKLSN